MGKLILWLLVLCMAVWWWLGRRKTHGAHAQETVASTTSENIVICAYCRLHVPESEAILHAGQHYCCDEHRKLDAA